MSHFFGRRFSGSGSGDGYNDHGLLIGLGDDDHLQYLITTAIRTEVTPTSGISKTGSGAGDVFTLQNAGTGAALFIRQTGNTTTADAALDIDNTGNVGRGLSVFSNTPDPDLPLVQFSALDESFDEPVLSITHANPCGLALQVLGDAYFACQIEVASGIVFGVHETSPIALGETGIYIKGDPSSPGEFYFVDKNGNERTFTSIADLSALLIEGCGINIVDSGDGYKIFSVDVDSLAGPGLDVVIGDDGCLQLTSTGGSAANLVEGCNIDLVNVDGYTSISVDVGSLAGTGLISVIGDDGCERLEVDFDGYLLQAIHIRKYGYEADDHPFNSVFSLDGYEYEVGRDRLIVTIDGLMQFPPQDYVEDSATTIEFVEPVDDNEVIDILLLPGSLGNIVVDGSSESVTVTLQNAYDDSPSNAKNIIVDDGQITFTQTQASGSVLRLISNTSITTGLTVDQSGGGEAARLKSVTDSKATLLVQKDTTARNTETDTLIIERTTSHVGGGLTGIGSGILTRLEDTGSGIFDASRITTGTESAADSSEKTFLAIELSDDGVMTEHMRLTSVGNLGLGTSTPNDFKLQVAGDIGPDTDLGYNLGSPSKRWRDGYFGSGSLFLDDAKIYLGSTNKNLHYRHPDGGQFDLIPDYAEQFITGAETTVINDAFVAVKMSGTTLDGYASSEFDITTSNRLRYAGSLTKKFAAGVSLTINSDTNNHDIAIGIGKNGAMVDKSIVRARVGTTFVNITTRCIIEMDTNDYIEVFLASDDAPVNLIVERLNFTAIQL